MIDVTFYLFELCIYSVYVYKKDRDIFFYFFFRKIYITFLIEIKLMWFVLFYCEVGIFNFYFKSYMEFFRFGVWVLALVGGFGICG